MKKQRRPNPPRAFVPGKESKKVKAVIRKDVAKLKMRSVDVSLPTGSHFRETLGEWQIWDDFGCARKLRKSDIIGLELI